MRFGPASVGVTARLVVVDALLLLTIAAVVAAAARAGADGRRVRAERTTARVGSPEQTLDVWRDTGVRGRILVHFSRSIAMSADAGPPSAANYLLRALEAGTIRSIFHVIPDGAWGEVQAALATWADVERTANAFHLRKAGVPIVVIRRPDLPRIEEPVLVTIEGERWSTEGLREIAGLLGTSLRPDVVVWTASAPERVAILEGLHGSR